MELAPMTEPVPHKVCGGGTVHRDMNAPPPLQPGGELQFSCFSVKLLWLNDWRTLQVLRPCGEVGAKPYRSNAVVSQCFCNCAGSTSTRKFCRNF